LDPEGFNVPRVEGIVGQEAEVEEQLIPTQFQTKWTNCPETVLPSNSNVRLEVKRFLDFRVVSNLGLEFKM
jgi:hypothetical protein